MTGPKTIFDILTTSARNPISSLKRIIPAIRKNGSSAPKDNHRTQQIRYDSHHLIIIRNPNKKDTYYLKRKYSFHHLHLEDILSPVQRPKIDSEDNYIFFVFHFPYFNNETLKIESKEIDFFLTKEDVIVIIEKEIPVVSKFIEDLTRKRKARSQFFEKGPGILIYHIFDKITDAIFPLIEEIEKGFEEIDQEIFTKETRRTAEKISFLRRNIIFFKSIIKPEINSFTEFEKTKHPFLTEEVKTHFSNISDHLKKIWDRLENLNELSDNLSSAFESYLTLKTNQVIKVLTIFSVVLLPLTLLSGIYGMNLSILPFANHPLAFFIIGLFMMSIVAIMLTAFRWKKWI